MDVKEELAELRTLVHAQAAEIRELRSRQTMLEAPPPQALSEPVDQTTPRSTPDDGDPDRHRAEAPSSRRRFLRVAGAAVTGGAAAAVLGASPAAAADNDPLRLGTLNSASSTTRLTTAETGLVIKAGESFEGVVAEVDGEVGFAVWGMTDTGIAGVFNSETGLDVLAAGSGRLRLVANLAAGPPTAGFYGTGEIIRDEFGDFWACVAGGEPGSWRKIAARWGVGVPHLLATPKRVYDSRVGYAPALGPKTRLVPSSPRTIPLTGAIPAGALGVILNVTVVDPNGPGWAAVTPGGAGFTGTANLNWTGPGVIVSNSVTVACPNTRIDLTSLAAADVVVDVFGYYR